MDAIAVQRLGTTRDADKVIDHATYCPLCAVEGLRRFALESPSQQSLRFFHVNIDVSDDPVVCAGCRLELAEGLNFGASSDPVGISEIADRLGVERATVDKWRVRDLLPEPDFIVGGRPAWQWRTIAVWAAATGRWRHDSSE